MSKFNPDETRVDLGEDLLEPTRVIEKEPAKSEVNILQEEIQKGEIFLNERLYEDAKKVFWKVLRIDPNNEAAKTYLEEIKQKEVQDLLSSAASRKKVQVRQNVAKEPPTRVLNRLDKELRLNYEKTNLKVIPDLFKSETELEQYKEKVLKSILALPPRARIDIGIAHLEMGLYEVAVEVFETVVRYQDHLTEGMYLLGIALIQSGKAIEATIKLEPFARDLTLPNHQKTDFLFLMGLAFESLLDFGRAKEFYRRVFALNPKYRDVEDRLKRES